MRTLYIFAPHYYYLLIKKKSIHLVQEQRYRHPGGHNFKYCPCPFCQYRGVDYWGSCPPQWIICWCDVIHLTSTPNESHPYLFFLCPVDYAPRGLWAFQGARGPMEKFHEAGGSSPTSTRPKARRTLPSLSSFFESGQRLFIDVIFSNVCSTGQSNLCALQRRGKKIEKNYLRLLQ